MRRSPLLRWLALAVALLAPQCTGSLSEDCNKTLTCGNEPGVTLDASCVWRFSNGDVWKDGPQKDDMGVWTWPDGRETDTQDYVCGGRADAGADAGQSPEADCRMVGCDPPLVCDDGSKRCVECLNSDQCLGSLSASGAPATLCDPVSHRCTVCLNDNDCAGTGETTFCEAVPGNPTANKCVQCERDNQCSGDTPACDENTNECTERCATDLDCSDPKPVCNGELCVQCRDDLQCASLPDTLQCDPRTDRCVGCLETADCTSPQVCKTAANLCVQCTDNNHCGGTTPFCDTASNTCVTCLDDANCPAVGASRCNRASHLCEACNSNTQCEPGAPVCKTSTGTCVGCVETRDCKDPAIAFCDTADNVCVECLNDMQCLTPAKARCDVANNNILNNTCAGCDSNEECSGKGFGPFCRDPGGNGVCVDCLGGAECQNNPALSRCDGSGVCAPCTNDDHCDLITNLPACNGNSCVECVNDTHCTNGQSCKVNNVGASAGPAAVNTCVECVSNADCPSASEARCFQNECVPCAGNGDCSAQVGLGICDLTGGADGGAPQCVQCTGPQRGACGVNVCNSALRTCSDRPAGVVPICGECLVSDAECVANARCAAQTLQGTDVRNFCFPLQAAGACPQAFVLQTTGPTLDLPSAAFCLQRDTTCPAFNDYLKPCQNPSDDSVCGVGDLDGSCEPFNTVFQCTFSCTNGNDCPGSADCVAGGLCEL